MQPEAHPQRHPVIGRITETIAAAVIASMATTYTTTIRHDEKIAALTTRLELSQQYHRETLADVRQAVAELRAMLSQMPR